VGEETKGGLPIARLRDHVLRFKTRSGPDRGKGEDSEKERRIVKTGGYPKCGRRGG